MKTVLTVGAMFAIAATMISYSGQAQPPAAGSGLTTDSESQIHQSAHAFATVFNKGDAAAIAKMFTEKAECRDANGKTIIGRDAIEKSYAEAFKAYAGATIEVLVKSIRFPSAELAVEEGILRMTLSPKALPTTTSYVAIHCKEAGNWKIALSSEAGAEVNRLEDLDWLLGTWTAKSKDETMTFSFTRGVKKTVMTGTFMKAGKETVTGSIRIAFDPETGGLRSWSFEDDGAHSQALWIHDGKSWILDCRGVLANGTPTAERIVLQRVEADAITWRSIERMVGDTALQDTPPLRLSREKSAR